MTTLPSALQAQPRATDTLCPNPQPLPGAVNAPRCPCSHSAGLSVPRPGPGGVSLEHGVSRVARLLESSTASHCSQKESRPGPGLVPGCRLDSPALLCPAPGSSRPARACPCCPAHASRAWLLPPPRGVFTHIFPSVPLSVLRRLRGHLVSAPLAFASDGHRLSVPMGAAAPSHLPLYVYLVPCLSPSLN